MFLKKVDTVCFKLFDGLRREKPDFLKRSKVLDSSLEDPLLGLSLTDRELNLE